jgi:very-short-patch-repair endonuclease
MTRIEFLEKARDKHGYKYEYPNLKDKIIYNDVIDIIYNGENYKQRVSKHLLGRCPEKNTPTKTTEEFIKESKKIWGDNKYDYSLTDYKGALKHIKIIYDGIIFEQIASCHLRSAPELNMNREYFIYKSHKKWGVDKYDYSLVDYKNCKTKVKIIYNKTGEIFEQTPELHLYRSPENIKLAVRKTTEQFITESNIVHYNKYSYDKTIYVKNQEKVIITCPKHGDFLQRPLSHLNGNGCPSCGESQGERKISHFLKERDINFERQKKFPDCRNVFELPFDFYIPSLRMCIEFDGLQHFQPIDHFGGLEAYEKLKINDKIKEDYCEENFINLIRIRYDQVDRVHQILSNSIKLKR